jgi:hypothetical protein
MITIKAELSDEEAMVLAKFCIELDEYVRRDTLTDEDGDEDDIIFTDPLGWDGDTLRGAVTSIREALLSAGYHGS